MLIQIVNFAVLCWYYSNFHVRFFGTLCNCFMGIFFTTPLSIATLVIRLNPIGRKCSYNSATVDYDTGTGFISYGDTYADDAEKLSALGVIGLILGVCQWTFCLIPLLHTSVDNFESHKRPQEAAQDLEL